ncbi:MAG: TPM domain-containing protein [Desulfobacterales bacterium]|nr:MAG: TPM domain-containing protein [Desulfobacterales bacterium]
MSAGTQRLVCCLMTVAAIAIVAVGCEFFAEERFDLEKIVRSRPERDRYIFDYAAILEDAEESSQRYLKMINEAYRIEALIVSVPSLEKSRSIEDLALEMFSNWAIGKKHDGRGILLLLAAEEKQVKLEISLELEDVFTDAFSGYAEDLQLRSYFLSDQLGIGLVALMEEMENRAYIKHQDNYTKGQIAQLDSQYLSQGAGATRDLNRFENEEIHSSGGRYPAGRTPVEAWQNLINSWRDKARDPNLGVYSAITRLTYRDFTNLPDSRYERDYRTYRNKSYEVISDGQYAVIYFGKKDGWENAPFLFARTEAGWQFDIVHQRKYIRMGRSPKWGIERCDHPYIDLLARCPYFMGQDIPFEDGDRYRVEADEEIARRIVDLENQYQRNPNEVSTAMALGKLYAITSMGQKGLTVLKKVKQLDPQTPDPYKYLAILYVDMFYQYEQAIRELEEYVRRRPDDVFGRNYLGYLYYETQRYKKAVTEWEKAQELDPQNGYAACKLVRAYGQMVKATQKIDPRRLLYKERTQAAYRKAVEILSPDHRRIQWLQRWLARNKIAIQSK